MLTHETGIKHVQGKLESLFGSRGSFVFAVDFGGSASVVRSGLDGCAVEFFLFSVDGGALGGSYEFARRSSEKNYAHRLIASARNGLCSFGGRRPHFHRTFLGDGGLFWRVLLNFAIRPGSLRIQEKILIRGTFITAKKICAACARDKGGVFCPNRKFFCEEVNLCMKLVSARR